MSGWIALSDREGLIAPCDNGALMARGVFVLELALPLPRHAVLLDWRRQAGWERAFSVFADPAAGVTVLHRQGSAVARHRLSGPLGLPDQGILRLELAWDAPRRSWTLAAEVPGSGTPPLLRNGRDPLPLPAADLAALCAPMGPDLQHPAVQWFGVARDAHVAGARTAWLGPRTPVETPAGPRPAADLVPGDPVLTDRGPATVAAARAADRPGRGSQAPVLLRAPYFGSETDLLVSADTPVALSGPEVEYLTGEETVLVSARNLCDGCSALPDPRRAVVTGVALRLDRPGLLLAAGCALAPNGPPIADLRTLGAYEAMPLLVLLGRGQRVRAA